MDLKKQIEERKEKELKDRLKACVADIAPVLEQHRFKLGAELVYTNAGITPRAVLIPITDEELTQKAEEKAV